MGENKIIELIHKKIDGTLSPSEERKLRAILQQDPEVRKTLNQLEQVSGLLDRVSHVEPPPHLSKHIMNRIDANRYAKKEPKTDRVSSRKRILAWIEPKHAIAFGTGVATILLILKLTQDHRIQVPDNNWQDLYGTIGISENLNFKSRETIHINTPSIEGSVDIQKMENVLGLEVALKSDEDFWLQVEYDPKTLRWNGLKPLTDLNLEFETGEHFIRIAQKTDMKVCLFFIQRGETASPLDLMVWQSEKVVWQVKTSSHLPADQ